MYNDSMKTTIQIKVKKQWEAAKGHAPHRSGAGTHDNRPKRQRTRDAQRRAWQREV